VGQTAEGLNAAAGAAGAAAGILGSAASGIASVGSAAGAAVGSINAYVEALRRAASAPKPGSGVAIRPTQPVTGQPFAHGGDVWGPGTATSDSIPALLSNGEFVVNARAAERFRPLLHAINRGAAGFASGGVVGGSFPAAPAGPDSIVAATAGDFSLLRGALREFMDALASEDPGKALEEMLISRLQAFADKMLQGFEDMIIKGLSQMFSGIGSGFGVGGGGLSQIALAAITGGAGGLFAKGGIFGRQGIVDVPTVFPFANGIGLMGEAGPEAIVPLSRGPDGRLGVTAAGFGAAAAPISMHFHNAPRVKEQREEDDGAGGRRMNIWFEEQTAGAIGRPGSKARGALASGYGLKPALTRR
jgi:hypothetical protein